MRAAALGALALERRRRGRGGARDERATDGEDSDGSTHDARQTTTTASSDGSAQSSMITSADDDATASPAATAPLLAMFTGQGAVGGQMRELRRLARSEVTRTSSSAPLEKRDP